MPRGCHIPDLGLLQERCCSGSIPAAPRSGQAPRAERAAGQHRSSPLLCWGSPSPAKAGSPAGRKGRDAAPAAGVWKQFAGWRGRRPPPLLISAGCSPGWGAAPQPFRPHHPLGVWQSPPLQRSPPSRVPLLPTLRAAPAWEPGQGEPSAAGGGRVSGGAGAVEHTAAIQPGCGARPCVNSPGSGPQ